MISSKPTTITTAAITPACHGVLKKSELLESVGGVAVVEILADTTATD